MVNAPKNVIIVDNDEERYRRLMVIIRKFGYNVFIASSGAELLKLSGGITAHAIVLGLRMPAFDSKTSVLQKIRSTASLAGANVIMVSTEEDHAKLDATINEGANACMVWPNTAAALFSVFEHLLGAGKRQSPRIRAIYKAILLVGSEKKNFVATSLSETGVFIRSITPLPVGTKVRMLLDLPTSRPLEVDGEVVRISAHDPAHHTEPGMGIKFLNLDAAFGQVIRAFVESLLSVEISDDMAV
ncbi:MAG: PilZ domain-containing protein [Deltaproteobacteria bacterium]|nr:PilZ domain-containing protein [Deltaproteobacteria bacterium]